MSRIAHITKMARERGRKLLIPYLVAGDPSLQVTVDLMHSLVESGADVIELGIPFSDPSQMDRSFSEVLKDLWETEQAFVMLLT